MHIGPISKLPERRYALSSEIWGIRREADRIENEVRELESRLVKLERESHSTKNRIPSQIRKIYQTITTKLDDRIALMNSLHEQLNQKLSQLFDVEQALRTIYKEAGKGHLPQPLEFMSSLSGEGADTEPSTKMWEFDLFVSHATEDKVAFVRDLVKQLGVLGLKVWFDEDELSIGDSLRQCIDRGLSRSKYGIVVLSPSFLHKKWTKYELDSLVALEIERGKVILPIWHGITKEQLLKVSPKLADKVALNSELSEVDDIALEIAIAALNKG